MEFVYVNDTHKTHDSLLVLLLLEHTPLIWNSMTQHIPWSDKI